VAFIFYIYCAIINERTSIKQQMKKKLHLTGQMKIKSLLLFSFLLVNAVPAFAQFTIYNTDNSDIPDDFVYVTKTDASNNLWIGTDVGLTKYDGTTWTTYSTANTGISSDNVHAIEIVSEDEIWFGTVGLGNGLNLYNGTDVIHYDEINGVEFPQSVYAIKKDNSGRLWIGGEYNTFMYDGTTLTDLGPEGPHYINSFIMVDGVLWAGSYGYGLYKYDGTIWTNYNMENSDLSSDFVERIAADSNGNLWMGGFGSNPDAMGLTKFDGTTFTNYNDSNSAIPRNVIYDLVIDSQDTIWIANGDGNDPGGLVKFDGTTFTLTNMANSNLPTNIILDLDIDTQDRLVLGTYAYGLAYYQLPTAAIKDVSVSNIHVYPNPAKDKITFDVPKSTDFTALNVSITDIAGKIVLTNTISTYNNAVVVNGLSAGVYMYKLSNDGYIIKTGKIVIE